MRWLARLGIGLVAAAGVTSGMASVDAPAVAAPVSATACRSVFLVPHQDDEVLSMGPAIRARIERDGAGSVCVALFTTGERSAVRTKFAGRGFLPAGATSPYVNQAIARSPAAFGRARDREFSAALGRLGVRAGNIFMDRLPGWSRVPDWNTGDRWDETRRDADEFVDAAIARFGPSAHYATMSDADPSVDHQVLGRALRDRSADVRSVAFYFPQYQLSLKPAELAVTQESAKASGVVKRAAGEYGLFKPAIGRYGIGWLSATRAFGGSAFGVKVWTLTGWRAVGPFLGGPDRSLLSTLKSYRHS